MMPPAKMPCGYKSVRSMTRGIRSECGEVQQCSPFVIKGNEILQKGQNHSLKSFAIYTAVNALKVYIYW